MGLVVVPEPELGLVPVLGQEPEPELGLVPVLGQELGLEHKPAQALPATKLSTALLPQ